MTTSGLTEPKKKEGITLQIKIIFLSKHDKLGPGCSIFIKRYFPLGWWWFRHWQAETKPLVQQNLWASLLSRKLDIMHTV